MLLSSITTSTMTIFMTMLMNMIMTIIRLTSIGILGIAQYITRGIHGTIHGILDHTIGRTIVFL